MAAMVVATDKMGITAVVGTMVTMDLMAIL
jgi:hypothetical protein